MILSNKRILIIVIISITLSSFTIWFYLYQRAINQQVQEIKRIDNQPKEQTQKLVITTNDPCEQTSTSTSSYNPKVPATWPSLTVYYTERIEDKELPIRNGVVQAEFITISEESPKSITQGPLTDESGRAIFRHLPKGRYKINARGGFRSDELGSGSSFNTHRWGSKIIDFCFDSVITIETETPSPPLATTIASTTLEIISASQVEWNPSGGFTTTLQIKEEGLSGGELITFYHIKTIGIIKEGRYKNKELLRVDTTTSGDDGPCKGLGCGNIYPGARFVKDDKTMVFLPKISSSFTRSQYERGNLFKKIGFDLIIDPNFSISILEFPAEISGSDSRQHLISNSIIEEFGNLDIEKLMKVFHHEILGDIYTTIPDVNRIKSFYYEYDSFSDVSVDGCNGESCFLTNGFFAFRPDDTFLKYFYTPDFSLTEIIWNGNFASFTEYDYTTRFGGCSQIMLDHSSIIHPSVLHDGDDLIIAGHNKLGDIIYVLKDNKHPLLFDLYENYKKYFYDWKKYSNLITPSEPYAYEKFLEARPIFFWYDSFGRIIRFQNNDFLPPGACEPIIYLYPPATQKVSVSIKPRGGITDSAPNYNDGWEVIVEPNGKIRDISSQKVYPYLFWEGWSWIFPIWDKGFVVSQPDIHEFFLKILPELGLENKEANDFMSAWEPRLRDAPYYFITFYDKDFIDYFVPLVISPKPDTVIRILMDYKPLDNPIDVQPIEIRTPQRYGFTIVEWGGLVR